jgi:PhzF family phenazine biosynthesis protein
MELEFFQVDNFTDQIFKGNPACVIPLKNWLPDETLLSIARENAVAETAFFIIREDKILLRWFTPEIEMDLCGHATLATAHVLKTILNYNHDKMVFETLSGSLTVTFKTDLYLLNLPARKPVPAVLPDMIKRSLSKQPIHTLKSRDFVLVYKNEEDIKNIKIDRQVFDTINLDAGGLVVTARGNYYDFVSRFFMPRSSVPEDSVTGSSHCSLIPYWSKKLGKKEMNAIEISERTGELYCIDKDDRVIIGGRAKTYSRGIIWTK